MQKHIYLYIAEIQGFQNVIFLMELLSMLPLLWQPNRILHLSSRYFDLRNAMAAPTEQILTFVCLTRWFLKAFNITVLK